MNKKRKTSTTAISTQDILYVYSNQIIRYKILKHILYSRHRNLLHSRVPDTSQKTELNALLRLIFVEYTRGRHSPTCVIFNITKYIRYNRMRYLATKKKSIRKKIGGKRVRGLNKDSSSGVRVLQNYKNSHRFRFRRMCVIHYYCQRKINTLSKKIIIFETKTFRKVI